MMPLINQTRALKDVLCAIFAHTRKRNQDIQTNSWPIPALSPLVPCNHAPTGLTET